MLNSTYLLLVLVSVLVISCSEHTNVELLESADGRSDMQLRPPQLLINSRMIDPESLFAEVSISFSNVTDSVTAQRIASTDVWTAQLQVPTQTAFTITITWFDLVDPERLDLVTSTRSFGPINFPGDMSINGNFSDFDSDDFDADLDSIVNLTERLNGTSPFDPIDTGPTPSILFADGFEFVNNADGAVNEISDVTDTLPVSVVQTVPVIDSSVPSSVDTPITLFFDDKLLIDSLPGNITVLENNQQIAGTITISESSNGFAILTFSASQPYQDGVTVILRITGGENGVQDDAGNRLTGNIGDDFEISITTLDQNVDAFNDNLSFENFDQGVVFTGDGSVRNDALGCLSATDGTNYAAISTGRSVVSNSSAVNDTSSTIQIGPINVGSETIDISFDYNFISAEFPEFLGTEFDDSSLISISGPDGTIAAVLTTVNIVGADGNSECAGIPDLNAESVFDDFSGQTGWMTHTVDIENIGSPIVITYTITDVADDLVTSILAIDNIIF